MAELWLSKAGEFAPPELSKVELALDLAGWKPALLAYRFWEHRKSPKMLVAYRSHSWRCSRTKSSSVRCG